MLISLMTLTSIHVFFTREAALQNERSAKSTHLLASPASHHAPGLRRPFCITWVVFSQHVSSNLWWRLIGAYFALKVFLSFLAELDVESANPLTFRTDTFRHWTEATHFNWQRVVLEYRHDTMEPLELQHPRRTVLSENRGLCDPTVRIAQPCAGQPSWWTTGLWAHLSDGNVGPSHVSQS